MNLKITFNVEADTIPLKNDRCDKMVQFHTCYNIQKRYLYTKKKQTLSKFQSYFKHLKFLTK